MRNINRLKMHEMRTGPLPQGTTDHGRLPFEYNGMSSSSHLQRSKVRVTRFDLDKPYHAKYWPATTVTTTGIL